MDTDSSPEEAPLRTPDWSMNSLLPANLGSGLSQLEFVRALRTAAATAATDRTTVALYAHPESPIALVIVSASNHLQLAERAAHHLRQAVVDVSGEVPRIDVTDRGEIRRLITERDPVAISKWWRSMTVHGPSLARLLLDEERRLHER